jgi:hypothetical protein
MIPLCERRKCPELADTLSYIETTPKYFFDLQTGSCKAMGESCGEDDGKRKVYGVTRSDWFPSCIPKQATTTVIRPVPPTPLQCKNHGQLFSQTLQRCISFEYNE